MCIRDSQQSEETVDFEANPEIASVSLIPVPRSSPRTPSLLREKILHARAQSEAHLLALEQELAQASVQEAVREVESGESDRKRGGDVVGTEPPSKVPKTLTPTPIEVEEMMEIGGGQGVSFTRFQL